MWAWGGNGFGQLGDGTNTSRSTAVQVQGLSNVSAIAAGDYHSLALGSDGSVWVWGNNGAGQLGDGTVSMRIVPVMLSGLPPMKAIAGGGSHSVAVHRENGTDVGLG